MTSTVNLAGRLGNHIIRNILVSIIAEKNNLHVEYSYYDEIKSIGINLFIGDLKYDDYIVLVNSNLLDYINSDNIKSNLFINDWFQSNKISNYLYNYLQQENIKKNIINNNIFNERYNNNNDVFIHIRLGDVEKYNPGFEYYDKILSSINFKNGYIGSDSFNHEICQNITKKYSNIKFFDCDEISTIKFASTCKFMIMSHGSFSAIIGYLSFFSQIYYPEFKENKIWCGDIFSIPNWNKISF